MLAWLLIGLIFHAILLIILRAYFAIEDARTPLFTLLAGTAIGVGVAFIFRASMGVAALGLAMTVGMAFNTLVLAGILIRRLSIPTMGNLLRAAFLFVVAALFSALAARGTLFLVAAVAPTDRVVGLFVQATFATLVGIGIYFVAAYLLEVKEVSLLWRKLRAVHVPEDVVLRDAPDEELPR